LRSVKEKEWSDSEGNRVKSSVKPSVGEPGAEGIAEGCLDWGGGSKFRDVDLDPPVPTRDAGGWRIRRSPDTPRPCSCSVTIGDLR